MCYSSSKHTLNVPLVSSCSSKTQHLQLSFLRRRRAQLKEARERRKMAVVKTQIKMRNLKLYKENQSLLNENERLRNQAMLLYKENQDLLSKLQKKLSQQSNKNN
ncbi:hypothetical protein HN51_023132 [Arachis hypogaea]|uniref:Uncharacterized protein n=1 Tax=Arachis hypogaea TaxID=3818 RepID=A0A445E6B0_ARAHY|nr:hypothetical protein Ahy_A02g005311 isoform A [Arachis hypogaea]RYR71006.1 hypothetical protein Ahy_A02g005311 isoform B [Arachis hypogaea]